MLSIPGINHRKGISSNGVVHRFTSVVPAVITGVLMSTASPSAKADLLDITSPTAIITHPAYAGLQGNIYHTALYPDESPEQKIFTLKIIPEANFKQVMEDYKEVIRSNQGFENFCTRWAKISDKHKISPEKQALLFRGMYTHSLIRLDNLGIHEYLGSFEPQAITALAEVSHSANASDCGKTVESLQKLLNDTREARTKQQKETIDFLKAMGLGAIGIIGLVILFFWITERRNK